MGVGPSDGLDQMVSSRQGKYYTTFDFGEQSNDKVADIWIRESDSDCNPAAANSSQRLGLQHVWDAFLAVQGFLFKA